MMDAKEVRGLVHSYASLRVAFDKSLTGSSNRPNHSTAKYAERCNEVETTLFKVIDNLTKIADGFPDCYEVSDMNRGALMLPGAKNGLYFSTSESGTHAVCEVKEGRVVIDKEDRPVARLYGPADI